MTEVRNNKPNVIQANNSWVALTSPAEPDISDVNRLPASKAKTAESVPTISK